MNFKYSLLAAALAAGPVVATSAEAATLQRYVVELKPNADVAHVSAVLTANGVTVVRVLPFAEGTSIAVDVDFEALPDVQALRTLLPEVATYSRDARRFLLQDAVPGTDPAPAALYNNTTSNGETTPYGIHAVQAAQVGYGGGRKVCIIDSGYKLGHPDLQTARVTGQDRGAGAWDGSAGAMHDHGTHVAGTIAALGGNAKGVVGVIPNGELDLHIVRAFDAGANYIYATDLAGAMLDCGAAGANVISMSLGGGFSSKAEEKAVNKLNRDGVLLIAAAGNDGNATFSYPASYDGVVSVAAVDANLAQANFSQRTSQVELSAPGVATRSTIVNGYGLMDGTSMATPHVSGVAALVWSNYKQCSNYEIRDALNASAKDLGTPGWDYRYGYGLVQAKAASDYLAAKGCKGR